MDKDVSELVARLCTVAGMIMEDVLPMALVRPSDLAETDVNLATLRQAGSDITALAGAAAVVARRGRLREMAESGR